MTTFVHGFVILGKENSFKVWKLRNLSLVVFTIGENDDFRKISEFPYLNVYARQCSHDMTGSVIFGDWRRGDSERQVPLIPGIMTRYIPMKQ